MMPVGYAEPRAIAAETNGGNLYISAVDTSTLNAVVLKMSKFGGTPTVLAVGAPVDGATPGSSVMTDPVAFALSPDETTLYIADFATVAPASVETSFAGAVLSVPTAGGTLTVVSQGAIDGPTGIACSKDGTTLYVSGSDPTTGQGAVWSLPTGGGTPTQLAIGGLITQPTGLGLSTNQTTIFIADAGQRLPSAQLLTLGTGVGPATLVTTIQNTMAVESGVASKDNLVYVAARQGSTPVIASVMEGSTSETTAASGLPFSGPNGIATDGASYYVADADASGNGLIVVLN
jgi:sugar lactone lactonase YvrE